MPNAKICKKYLTWYHLTHSPTFNPPPAKSLIQHLGHQSGVLDPGIKLVLSTSTTRSASTLDTKTF